MPIAGPSHTSSTAHFDVAVPALIEAFAAVADATRETREVDAAAYTSPLPPPPPLSAVRC